MFLLASSDYKVKSVSRKGKGILAKKEIAAGTLVGDYLGRIVSDKEADRLEKKVGGHYAFEYIGNNTSIWPLDCKATDVHLINHSCAPNCSTVDVAGHNIFYALRHIFPGEELTIDYEFDSESGGGPATCFCASPFCRGTMHARVKEHCLKLKKIVQNQPKFKAAKIGEVLLPLAKYPKIINDYLLKDGSRNNLYANLTVNPLVCRETSLPALPELRRRLRLSGRRLYFSRLNLTILGVADGHLLAKR